MNHGTRFSTKGALLCLLLIAAHAASSEALINLEWRPMSQTSEVGARVEIGLYAVSDDPEMDQLIAAMDVIVSWDPAHLQLIGVDCIGCPNWLFSGFSNDPYGINEEIPPQDGVGIYSALSPLGMPIPATPQGTLVTIFQFDALAITDDTLVDILESAGSPTGYTVVYDGTVPGLDVTGTLGNAHVEILCQICPGDLDGDDDIDLSDLAELLSHYGMTSGAMPYDGDLNCDGDVDLSDLAALLSVYGTTCD